MVAQITETKVSSCANKELEIDLISIIDGRVQFNEEDFRGFSEVRLFVWQLSYETNYNDKCESIDFFNREPDPNSVWEQIVVDVDRFGEENGHFDLDKCKDYAIKLMVICENDTLFSNCSVYQKTNDFCSKRIKNQTLKQSNFIYFPQPTSEVLFIKNINNHFIENIKIYSLTKQILHSEKFNTTDDNLKINLPKLNTGIYIIEIKTQNNFSYFNKISIE